MTLEDDMLTLRTEPRRLLPTVGHSRDTGFAGHELFEASSIRKIRGNTTLFTLPLPATSCATRSATGPTADSAMAAWW